MTQGFCTRCRSPVQAQARFCSHCGHALGIRPDKGVQSEKRHLTVMFCDLVGSTELSTQLDAERYHELLRDYYAQTTHIVSSFGGHVAQYLGDGVLAYFGYPLATEHDADSAVIAADAIVRRCIDKLSAGAQKWAVRIGIHSGVVVLDGYRSDSGSSTLAFGEATNVAARVQTLASQNEVLITAATRGLLNTRVSIESLGEKTLKGVPRPIELFRVRRAETGRARSLARPGLEPIVGRKQELETLSGFLAISETQAFRALLILGEPGIGKSRLMEAIRQRPAHADSCWIDLQCSPFTQGSAYHPLIELIERQPGLDKQLDDQARLAALRAQRPAAVSDDDEWLELIAPLLALSGDDREARSYSANMKRQKTVFAMSAWLAQHAQDRQAILCIEDLHWADDLTREVLGELIDEHGQPQLRVLLTSRPDRLPSWINASALMAVNLEPLSVETARELIEQMPGCAKLHGSLRSTIIDRAAGIPLYLEELAKTVLDSVDTTSSFDSEIDLVRELSRVPESLQDSLMARLDKLGPARRTAQQCAVIGRHFDLGLLQEISECDPEQLKTDVQALIDAGLVIAAEEDHYSFRHALIQDAAYDSMLARTRAEIHRGISVAIACTRPDIVKTQPERLAWHYENSGQVLPAIECLCRAVGIAANRSANRQAATFASQALQLLTKLEDKQRAAQLEVELQVMKGSQLVAVSGYAHPEVGEAFERAHHAFQSETPPHLKAGVLRGLSVANLVRANHERSIAYAEEMLALGIAVSDPMIAFAGKVGRINPLGHLGRLSEALDVLAEVEDAYNPVWSRQARAIFSQNLNVAAKGYIAIVMWLNGRPRSGEYLLQQVAALADREGHPFDRAYIKAWDSLLALLQGRAQIAMRKVDDLLAYAENHGIFHWIWNGRIQKGLAMAMSGDVRDGLKLMRDSHSFLQRVGGPIDGPMFYALEAEQCLRVGQIENAGIALSRAEELAHRHQERCWDAEIMRFRGLLAERAQSNLDTATVCYREALAIAQRQQACTPALRASLDLARMATSGAYHGDWRADLQQSRAAIREPEHVKDCAEADAILASASELPGGPVHRRKIG